jgi:epothilone synthetase B
MIDSQARVANLTLDKLKLLAQRLKKGPRESILPVLAPAPAERYEPFPLTDVQEAYWIGRQGLYDLGNVSSHAYLEIPFEDLDLDRLNAALQRLVERHEMLRAVILPDGRQQVLASVPPYEIAADDLRGLDAAAVERALAATRGRMSHQVLPSDRWPLFELRGTRLEAGRALLHLSFDILIGDIWSFQLLQRELQQLYVDPGAALPSVDLSFRDYVMSLVAFERTPQFARSLEYWQRRLPLLPPAPELPLAVTPAALRQPRFRRRLSTLDPEPWGRLKQRASGLGITPSGLLLAAYGEVLAVWSKSPRFTINVTTFNRLPIHPQVNEVVGDFTSLTLAALDLGAGGSFEERARGVQQQLWRDLEHGHVSAVRLLRQMTRPGGGAPGAGMPVVFTSLLFDDAREEKKPAQGRQPGGGDSHNISQTPQVWLDFQVGQDHGTLVFNWDAVEDLFPPGLLDDMFAAFCGLLDALAAGDEAWTRQAPPEIPPAHRQLIRAANATVAPWPDRRLHEPFEERAARHPERVAVVSRGLRLTYSELEGRANRVAHRLRAAGARPGRLVAVVMEKGWEQVVAVLAVVKSGAAYLPVDPDLPRERVFDLLARGEVETVLTQPWIDERLDWPDGVARLRIGAGEPAGGADSQLPPSQRLEDLAYVIFTSGSTGVPKGVMIDHRGAVNTLLDCNRRFGVSSADRVLALSALSFDLSVYDVFGLLAAGGTVVMPESTAVRSPERWLELMRAERVTVWDSVPALMQMLVEYALDRGAPPLPDLRLVMLSGDWIPVGLPDQVRVLAPSAQVVGMGGATEASIWSVLYPIGAVDPAWRSIPYGKAMDSQTMEVLDHALQPRPVWVPGDLYIGGIGVAQGYWHDEERTVASFVEHPAGGRRLYRTGDLARLLPDGNLEFLGREDLQVKVQGYRIELGEIEAALEEHPAVRHAVALAIGEGAGNRRLAACVVLEPEAAAAGVAARATVESGTEPDAPTTAGAVTRAEFGRLLGALAALPLPEAALPKYRYPSAGNLYPVQTYVLVHPGGVEGVAAGAYYFHPREGALVPLSPGPAELPSGGAAFSIFLVGQRAAVEPVYGGWSHGFCLLEAGYMGELLQRTAAGCCLDLVPAGMPARAVLDGTFALDAGHLPLLALVAQRSAGSAPAAAGLGGGFGPDEAEGAGLPVRDTLAGPLEQLEFKLREPGLRRGLPPGLPLPAPAGEAWERAFVRRRSHREFLPEEVGLPVLRALLAEAAPPAEVRVYLHVKPRRVVGAEEGVYAYDAEGGRLTPVFQGDAVHADLHAAVNRAAFEQSAFSLFFVAAPAAAAALAAGALGQRLMEAAPGYGLGLCPIGTFEFKPVGRLCGLGGGETLVHSLIGGPVPDLPADEPALSSSAPGWAALEPALREHLARKLPSYMVPALLTAVDDVPLSANGKVDRKALARRLGTPPEAKVSYAPPRTDLERQIAGIWQEVLAGVKVGMNDSFFELGGHSVSMVRMHRKLQDLVGHEVSLTQLFAHPTPRALANFLSAPRAAADLGENLERAGLRRAARDRRRRPGGPAAGGAEGGQS